MERVHPIGGTRPYSCDLCTLSFKLKNILSRHMLTHFPNSMRKFVCNCCDRRFSQSHSFKYHVEKKSPCFPIEKVKPTKAIVKKSRLFPCDTCGSSFKFKCLLIRHTLIHGSRMFKCEVCSKTFTRSDHLDTHKKTHLVVETIQCSLCTLTFKGVCELKKHCKKVHDENFPFTCSECDEKMKTQVAFKKHMKIHYDMK